MFDWLGVVGLLMLAGLCALSGLFAGSCWTGLIKRIPEERMGEFRHLTWLQGLNWILTCAAIPVGLVGFLLF